MPPVLVEDVVIHMSIAKAMVEMAEEFDTGRGYRSLINPYRENCSKQTILASNTLALLLKHRGHAHQLWIQDYTVHLMIGVNTGELVTLFDGTLTGSIPEQTKALTKIIGDLPGMLGENKQIA